MQVRHQLRQRLELLTKLRSQAKIKIGVFSDKNPFGYVDENGKVQGV